MTELTIEWLKLKKYKPFWILLILYPFSIASLCLLIWSLYGKMNFNGMRPDELLKESPFAFPNVWKMVTYTASFFHFFPSIIILLSICNEFEYRTHRQAILNGQSRAQLFASKVILAGLVSLGATAVIALTALIMGLVQGGGQPIDGIDRLGAFFVQSLVYSSFAVFLGFQIRHGLGSLAMFLIYSNFLEKIVLFSIGRYLSQASSYGPLAVANQLVPFPVDLSKQLKYTPIPTETLLAVSGLYLAIFLGLSWWGFRQRDI